MSVEHEPFDEHALLYGGVGAVVLVELVVLGRGEDGRGWERIGSG